MAGSVFSWIMLPNIALKVQEWFEEQDKEFKVLPRPPNSLELNPVEQLWDVREQDVQSTGSLFAVAPAGNLQDLHDLTARSELTTFRVHLATSTLWLRNNILLTHSVRLYHHLRNITKGNLNGLFIHRVGSPQH